MTFQPTQESTPNVGQPPAPVSQEPIPVTVLSGFLGSGKTTLLNHLLQQKHGLRVAVIVNEFGSVGIDGALVSGGERFVELDNGCLCCALNEDLQGALRELVAHSDAAAKPLERIVIESTGLALPLPVAWTCSRPELSQRLRVDAIVTVVDAANIVRALAESREARTQVEQADLIIVNKVDLVEDNGEACVATVRAVNDVAPLLRVEQAAAPWAWVMATPQQPRAALQKHAAGDVTAEPAEPISGASHMGHEHPRHPDHSAGDAGYEHAGHLDHNAGDTGHEHAGHLDHGAGAPHASAHAAAAEHSFASWSYERPPTAVFDEAKCEELAFAIPEAVIRFKALMRVDDAEGPWLLIHGVGGRIDLRFMKPTRPPTHSAWVFFGQALDVPALQALCNRYLLEGTARQKARLDS